MVVLQLCKRMPLVIENQHDVSGDKIIVLLTIDMCLRFEEVQSMTIFIILETTSLK